MLAINYDVKHFPLVVVERTTSGEQGKESVSDPQDAGSNGDD